MIKKLIAVTCTLGLALGINTAVFALPKDTVAPKITQTDPKNNAVNINTNKEITITFSEPVVKGPAFSKISLVNEKKKSVSIITIINKNKCVIKHKANLDFNGSYTLTIPYNSVRDNSGNNLKNGLVLKFKVKKEILPPVLNLKLVQNGKECDIKNQNQECVLEKDTFSIRLNIPKDGAAKISALDNEESFNMSGVDTASDDVVYFSDGYSMASNSNGQYETMCINNEANHYLFYSDNPEESRVKFIGKNEDNTIGVEWKVNGLSLYDESEDSFIDYSFADAPSDKIYLVVYVDFNSNKIIDSGEYFKVILSFKPDSEN